MRACYYLILFSTLSYVFLPLPYSDVEYVFLPHSPHPFCVPSAESALCSLTDDL